MFCLLNATCNTRVKQYYIKEKRNTQACLYKVQLIRGNRNSETFVIVYYNSIITIKL